MLLCPGHSRSPPREADLRWLLGCDAGSGDAAAASAGGAPGGGGVREPRALLLRHHFLRGEAGTEFSSNNVSHQDWLSLNH